MTKELTLPIAEVFGQTWQGEGPHTGIPATFVRLGHCNLRCSWCDTSYTWDTQKYDLAATCPPTDIEDVLAKVRGDKRAEIVVLTGGEPLLWQNTPAWKALTRGIVATRTINNDALAVHVETNGTIAPAPHDAVMWYSVSPKLAHGGDPEKRRIKPKAITQFVRLAHLGTACFKFVCQAAEDIEEVQAFCERFDINTEYVWIMPEGTCTEQIVACHRAIAPAALAAGYRTCTRLHSLLWGNERGH